MRKEDRHRAKRNDLVTAMERVTLYVEENTRKVGWIAAGLVIAVIGGLALSGWLREREAAASMLLGQIIRTYRAPLAFSAESQQVPAGVTTFATAQERDQKVVDLADDLLRRHGSSSAAPKALYYKALGLQGLGQWDETSKALEDLLKRYPSDFLAPMARYQLARAREAQGNAAEALIQFQALVEGQTGLFPRAEALLGVARCQTALGKKDEAKRTYERIQNEFAGSDYAGEARSRAAEIS